MKLTFNRKQLAAAIDRASSAISRSASRNFPALGCVRLTSSGGNVDQNGETTVVLCGTDKESLAIVECPATIGRDSGSLNLLLPADKMQQILRSVSGDAVDCTLDDSSSMMLVKCGRSEFKVGMRDPGEFPPLDSILQPPGACVVDAADLAAALKRAAALHWPLPSASFAHGTLLDCRDGWLYVVAADGYTAALQKMPLISVGDAARAIQFTGTLPVEFTRMAVGLLPSEGQVSVNTDGSNVQFSWGNERAMGRLLSGRGVPYRKVLERIQQMQGVDFRVNPAALRQAVDASLVAAHKEMLRVKLSLMTGLLAVSATGIDGEVATTEIDAEYAGEPLTMYQRGDKLSTFLQQVDGDAVDVRIVPNAMLSFVAPGSGVGALGWQFHAAPQVAASDVEGAEEIEAAKRKKKKSKDESGENAEHPALAAVR